MHKWEERQRIRNHEAILGKARPTVKQSWSREKHLTCSRSKLSVDKSGNMSFRRILSMFNMDRYESLLVEYGFPHKIIEKESLAYLAEMIERVKVQDQESFLSFLSTLMSISKRLPPPVKRNILPVTRKSIHVPQGPKLNATRQKITSNFRIKKSVNKLVELEDQCSRVKIKAVPDKTVEKTVKKGTKIAHHDDCQIIHSYGELKRGKPQFMDHANGIVRRMRQKLRKMGLSQQNNPENQVSLDYQNVWNMYISYDTAKLTSNITNIDIEQIINCFSEEIITKIKANPVKSAHPGHSTQEITELLKESLLMSNQKEDYPNLNYDSFDDAVSKDGSEDEDQSWLELSAQSNLMDFECFRSEAKEDTSNVKNFIQLVMMGGKLEKQSPIIAYAYIRRLLSAQNRALDEYNWKNIVLITLILSSKIWDDRSLQNQSFAKVLKPYSTMEINRLEKHLVGFLEYKLRVEPQQYCESYFLLRRHSASVSKTANLVPLDIRTIHRLQGGGKKRENKLKQMYKDTLNRSF